MHTCVMVTAGRERRGGSGSKKTLMGIRTSICQQPALELASGNARGWRQTNRVPASQEGAQPDGGDTQDWRRSGDGPHEGEGAHKFEDLSCSINRTTTPF